MKWKKFCLERTYRLIPKDTFSNRVFYQIRARTIKHFEVIINSGQYYWCNSWSNCQVNQILHSANIDSSVVKFVKCWDKRSKKYIYRPYGIWESTQSLGPCLIWAYTNTNPNPKKRLVQKKLNLVLRIILFVAWTLQLGTIDIIRMNLNYLRKIIKVLGLMKLGLGREWKESKSKLN